MKDFAVITLRTAIDEGILYFAPEPKSPHGVDVTPKGEFIVVAGKLDPHVSVYSIAKIRSAILAKNWTKDPYGVPILNYDAVCEAQVELGLGPLHTQFDDKGYAYTSLFLDSAVARWTLGGQYQALHSEPAWTLVTKKNVQYNIGHLTTAEGDVTNPDGKYLVALNKWSIDRFFHPGPLYPQNLQLIDISQPGDRMQVLYDMPLGVGEPHYAQMIKADKLKPWTIYPEVGWDPVTQAVDPDAPKAGQEKIVRDGKNVAVYMTANRSHFTPEHVKVKQGDHVVWKITNIERTEDATHGFSLPGYNINLSLEPGETATLEFKAVNPGVYTWYCSEFCSALHLEMMGYFLVEPSQTAEAPDDADLAKSPTH
jgi:nitrous-oxide reductase